MLNRGLRRAVVFGESLIDVYPHRRVVAGASLHVAAHLAATGWQVDLVSRIGADHDGGRIVAALRSLGVNTDLIEMDHDLPTGQVSVRPRGDFDIGSPAAYDEIDGPAVLRDHSLFCYGTLAARSDISRATLLRLLSVTRGLRALDVNLRSPHFAREVVSPLVARAQLLKTTRSELDQVAGLLRIQAVPQAFFRANRGLKWLCVTRGPDGAELYSPGGGHWSALPPRVDVIDTVGAGDAFFARLTGALTAGFSEEAALRAATIAAGETLGRYGGLPLGRDYHSRPGAQLE